VTLPYELSVSDTPIHRLSAWTKGCITLCLILLAFVSDPVGLLVLVGLVLTYALIGRITPKEFASIFLLIIPFGLVLTVVQVLTHLGEGPTVTLAGITLPMEGLELGLTVALRTLVLALAASLFVMTTHPSELSATLSAAGMPFRYSYLTGIALRFLPLFFEEFNRVIDAQESRGADINRWGIVSRMLVLPALILPLTVGAVRRSGDIAIAMEMRGLSTASTHGRTSMQFRVTRPIDFVLMATVVILTVLAIAVR
jgi:energy-coupling factor transport system permease protein